MATKVHMEALSPTMEEGQVVRWLKSEGDAVKEGDVLAEIETDKATMELVARGAGVLRKIALTEGGVAPVGQVIGVIAAADEDIESILATVAAGASGSNGGSGADSGGQATQQVEEAGPAPAELGDGGRTAPVGQAAPDHATPPGPEAGGLPDGGGSPVAVTSVAPPTDDRIKASPLARRLAAESGVDLRTIRGSGPGGRIVKSDITAVAGRPVAAASAATAPPALPAPAPAGPEVEEIPLTQMRKTIARRLVTSIGPVPTFYLTRDVDMRRAVASRERMNALLERDGIKASINDIVLKAVAVALSLHPEVNASWGETVVRRYRRVHLGVAVAVEDGLITPVVRDADRKRVRDIAVEVRQLVARARDRRLKPEEYTGATFSVSNLGMFGIEEFTAIINPPEAGILAVGRVEDRVVAEDGQPVVRPRMRMTMSCDHRVVDGAMGARFLQTLTAILEDPALMLA